MDSALQSFTAYAPIAQLNPPPSAPDHQHASVNSTTWSHGRVSAHTTPLTPAHSSMFSVPDHTTDLEYPSPTPSSSNASPLFAHSQHLEQYPSNPHFASASMASSNGNILDQLNQIESRIGPTRVMTRRQRAQMEQKLLGRGTPLRHHLHRAEGSSLPRLNASLYTHEMTHLRSNNEDPTQVQRDRLSVNISNPLSLQVHSPSYQPMTPASMPSPSYPYAYGNSRSTSGSTSNYQQASSPAPSLASELSSASSASPTSHAFSPYTRPTNHNLSNGESSKPKQKKQRLDNTARKNICLYHEDHPNARQEDIAAVFKVERSTISKILKYKNKWLNTPQNQDDRVVKHRPSKFPDIEDELEKWLASCTVNKTTICDHDLRREALEIAKRLGYPEEKFKASSGWLDGLKTRHRIRGGVWLGRDDETRLLMTESGNDSVISPSNPGSGSGSSHSQDLNMNISQPTRDEEMVSSQGPARQEDQEGLQATEQLASSSTSGGAQASWMNSVQSTHSLTQSPLSAHHPIDETHPPDHVSSHQPATQIQQQQPVHSEHYVEGTIYYNPVHSSIPSLGQAENALNTVILYVDAAARRDLLLPEERQLLHNIKCALFQEGSGIPFDRSTHR